MTESLLKYYHRCIFGQESPCWSLNVNQICLDKVCARVTIVILLTVIGRTVGKP